MFYLMLRKFKILFKFKKKKLKITLDNLKYLNCIGLLGSLEQPESFQGGLGNFRVVWVVLDEYISDLERHLMTQTILERHRTPISNPKLSLMTYLGSRFKIVFTLLIS